MDMKWAKLGLYLADSNFRLAFVKGDMLKVITSYSTRFRTERGNLSLFLNPKFCWEGLSLFIFQLGAV